MTINEQIARALEPEPVFDQTVRYDARGEACTVSRKGFYRMYKDGRCYTTDLDVDWAAMGALLEALKKKGFGYCVEWDGDETDRGLVEWHRAYVFKKMSVGMEDGEVQALTLPLAVRDAAARALGITTEESQEKS